MKRVLLILLLIPICLTSQTIYNPHQFYEFPGGLFDKDSIRSVYIDFIDPNYHSILVNSFFTNPKYRIPATVTCEGVVYDSVGVRYKGNSTFCLPNDVGNPKVPYNLDFNYFVSGQKFFGKKKIKLANAWMDPTFMKEFSASQIYKNYLPSPEVNLVKLYVQGNYLGLYVNTESINKQFTEKHYDEKNGSMFKCDGSGMFCDTTGTPSGGVPDLNWLGEDTSLYYNSYDMKSDFGWGNLLNLIEIINFNPQFIDSVLDVDRTLWAFAVNQVISNLDTYNGYYVHNYYLYQREDGLFNMIPWDLSESFVGAIMGWSFWNPSDVYEYDPYYGDDPSIGRPLTALLLNHPTYRKQYTAHLRTVINESLDTTIIRAKIQNLQALAYNAVINDNYKAFGVTDFYNNVENAIWTGWGFGGIMSTINERKNYLLNHPEISLLSPIISNVIVNNNIVEANVINTNSVELMYTSNDYNSKFKSLPMNDVGINGDLVAGDGIYSVFLPTSPNLKFYIRSQNNDAMMLSPEKAQYEFYEYSSVLSQFTSPLNNERELLKIIDVTGRNINFTYNVPLFFVYSDGVVEKKIFIK